MVGPRGTTEAVPITADRLTAPCMVADIDVAAGLPEVLSDSRHPQARCAWLLVRDAGRPVGVLMMSAPSGLLVKQDIARGIDSVFGSRLAVAAEKPGQNHAADYRVSPSRDAARAHYLSMSERFFTDGPGITVAVCTRENAAGLMRCLSSLVAQQYPRFDILVVDNAPSTAGTADVVAEFRSAAVPVRYALESTPGLSWARNRAIDLASHDVVACIDDDETADQSWLAELALGFLLEPDADVVSGVMLPAELSTAAQVRFEQYGGFFKHRGFDAATFSSGTASTQSPFFPLPPFGAGGNMAIRRDAILEVGGFDTALGAGSLSLASEDTRAITDILLSGGTVVYQPSAVTRHWHRVEHAALRRQMLGYGAGLTAFYASLVLAHPRYVVDLVRLAPLFLGEAAGAESLRSGDLPTDFPSDLRWANRRGLLEGPARYMLARMVARWRARRAERLRSIGASRDPSSHSGS